MSLFPFVLVLSEAVLVLVIVLVIEYQTIRITNYEQEHDGWAMTKV